VSFLSIAFLAALPLAAAPLLLHFLDRRRNVVIEWGAMQFLQEAATKRTSARRLKELLLLLMRIAALLALILALARPLAPGNWLGTTDRSETILIVDNSMSMMRNTGGTPLLEQLISQAGDAVQKLSAGDSVRILLASPYPVWVTPASVRVDSGSKSKLVQQLNELRSTDGSSDLLASLFTAVQADADATLQQRRVVLITDGQGTDWKLDDVAGWQRFQAVLSEASIPTELEIIELDDSATAANQAVAEIRSSRTVVGVNQSFVATAKIQNHSKESSQAGKLRWIVDGKPMLTQGLPAMDGGDSQSFVWKHNFPSIGVFAVSCRIDSGDDLTADNHATVVVEVVDRIPILLIEGAEDLADVQQDAFFVQAALGRIDGEQESGQWQSVFAPRTVSPQRLETIELDPFRAIVVPNLTELSERTSERLHRFVANGGGLWIALGPRTDVDAFNHYFFNDGDGLSPMSLAGLVDDSENEQSALKINPFGKDHPAVAELADVERLDIGDVKVTGRFRFKAGISYDDVSVLLDLTNGEPLAVEKYVGSGRVIVQSIPLRFQWSDLAISQSFVVMVHDWLAYLTHPRATRHNLAPGDPISVHLSDSQFVEATLTTPHGDVIDLASEPAGEGVVFRSSRTILPGEYSLELGLSGDQIPFYIARDPDESNLAPLAAVDRQLLSETAGLSRNRASRTMTGTNRRDPVWPLLLMVLIALIAGELLLSGVIARERFGSETLAETTGDWLQQADSVAVPGRPSATVLAGDRRDGAGTEPKEFVELEV
jgi:hypothetical protein